MAFRFVHTADIHLDSPLKSLALRDPELARLVETATRDALTAIVDLCLAEDVEALLIAGDLNDGTETSMKTAVFLAAQLERLAAAGIRTFIVRGNHDAKSKILNELDLPEAVSLFGGHAGLVEFESRSSLAVAVHGVSFGQPHIDHSLLPKYMEAVEGAFNIGVMHTSLEGAAGHDPYAPVSVADLTAKGYDYWALGHIHRRAVYGDGPVIVMPGIPQGRHVNEAGPKSVTLATVNDDGDVTLTERFVAGVEFARRSLDVTEVIDWDDVRSALTEGLADLAEATTAPQTILRLELTGQTPFAWRLRRDADSLIKTARLAAARIGGVWIERIDVACTAESSAAEEAGPAPPDELAEHIARILAAPDFQADAEALAKTVIESNDMPVGLRDAFGADPEARREIVASLAEAGGVEALARLTQPGEADD